MLVFIMFQLGRLNRIQCKVALSVIGLLAVVGGVVSCIGVCNAAGLMFSRMHNILPFVLLGVGVDDIFVIVQSFDSLEGDEGNWTR